MQKRIYNFLNKLYGILMTLSFFGGFVPFFPFLFAIIVGGEIGETIALFCYKTYYPCVIVVGSIAILIGLIAMYVGKMEALSVNKVSAENKKE